MRVRELMTPEPLILMVDDTVEVAKSFNDFAHIRHLPVVDGARVVGLVTHRDILRATISLLSGRGDDQQESQEGIAIAEIMRRDVSSISADADVRLAIRTMMEHKYGCLPVVENDKLVGILTEADFLKFTLSLVEREND